MFSQKTSHALSHRSFVLWVVGSLGCVYKGAKGRDERQ